MSSDKVDPIHQFHINSIVPIQIGDFDVSFTNSALFMLVTTATVAIFLVAGTASRSLIPGRWQAMAELSYEFVAKMLKDAAGKDGMRYFPFVFALFMYVLTANLYGMFPYFFTTTSHIIVTFTLAMMVILTVVISGLINHGLHFFKLFVPSGVPAVLIPLVTAIEIISFLSRPVSLSVRLFANILAGHIAVKVFAGFIVTLGALGIGGWLAAILPLGLTMALTALEFLVAFLQAYVFAILTCMYLHDALHPGH
ncbi:F0F1 ATP synthase subunit A [Segnochrobactraceae bacterium EtOH-i3]